MKTLSKVWIISLFLIFGMSVISYAQPDNLQFEHISVQHGLSQSSVLSIYQDREGFMWFGTLDGLNKYDGYSFTVFKPDPNDPEHSFQHNMISDIHEDRKGRLWVTTFGGGLHKVDKRTKKVTPFRIDFSHIGWNVLWNIHEDKMGILWIGSTRGIARFDPQTKQYSLYPAPTEGSVIFSLAEDASGRLWVGSEEGLYHFDRLTGKFIPFPMDAPLMDLLKRGWALFIDSNNILWVGTKENGLFSINTQQNPMQVKPYNPNGQINKNIWLHGITEDTHGNLWIGTTEGLQTIDKKIAEVVTYQANLSLPATLNSNIVQCIYQDRTGSIWIGTNMGINKIVAHSKPFYSYQIIQTLSSVRRNENYISTLLEDQTGMVWLGSAGSIEQGSFQHGLFQFDPVNKKTKHIFADSNDLYSLSSDQVWAIHEDNLGKLWIGTTEGLHQMDRSTGKFIRYPSDIPVMFIDEDSQGKLWVGGYGWMAGLSITSAVASFDPTTGQYNYYTYSSRDTTGLNNITLTGLLASKTGDIWIATGGGGINRLNPKTNKFTYYTPDHGNTEGHLNDKDVRALYEDKKGIIWAGTNQGGLHKLDPATEIFTFFTTREGLPSNHIVSIIEDEKENLWIGTNKGICKFNPENNTFRSYDISDGLPDDEFVTKSVFSRNGKLMFGSVDGFVIFYPDSIKDNTAVPPVYITDFKVVEKNRSLPEDKVELPYDENFLSFEFVALNYDAPEKNQYAYKLEGADKDWVYSGTRRFASYPNLDPGEYKFNVKASNNDGVWNEQGASLQVTILPPFYQTWWAYSLYGMLAIGFLYGLRQLTVKRERLKHELKLQKLEAEKMHEIDHMKSRFFANISHEFRTPLTLILGPLEKLLCQPAYDKEHSLLSMMHRNAQRLLQLINQLLELSKLEAGSVKLEAKVGNIVSFLKAAVLSFTSMAEKRQIHFTAHFPDTNPTVSFDADKLEKIVVNLLSNAFKFTPSGGNVTVSVSLLAMQQEKNKQKQLLEMKVKDSGMGIPPAQTDKIFNRFYQVNGSHPYHREGTGIGLSLTKELVELHGGQINLFSQEGKGSTFTIRLPLEVTEQILTPTEQGVAQPNTVSSQILEEFEQENVEQQHNKKILKQKLPLLLLVEDNADVRSYILESLKEQYRIVEAINGAEALDRAIQQIPDLIISDVMMPEMDGMELCHLLKTDERTSHIPVILLTAKAGEDNQLQGLETGADDYLTKPFNTKKLKIRIKNLIEQRARLRGHFSKKFSVEPKDIAVTSADENFLQRALAVIEANMAKADFDVETFGREVGMSRTHLHRKLKALTDQSASDFIRIIRLKRAAELLSKRTGNVSEVAYLVGFKEQSYFSRCFKQTFGCSPSEYATKDI